jgi:iron(III) transport system substrate-binding protein
MKKLMALVLSLAMLLSLSAAANAEATGADVKGTGVQLTIYTNSGSNGRDAWLIERAKQDGFNLVVLEEGAGAIQQRIIGEAANPIADVVYGLNAIIWNDLINRECIVKYDAPSWASEVSEGLNDPNGYYYAIVKQAILLVYDQNQLSAEDAPKDWTELATNFAGKYEIPGSLTGGTTRNVIAGILSRYLDENGELGVSQEGWDVITAFYQNGVVAESGVDLYAQIANPSSPVVMGQMWSSGVATRDETYGTKTGYVVPEVGVPYAVEGIGIINGTKNMDEALRFVEWFGSAKIQGECAQSTTWGTMPANTIAAELADPYQRELCSIPAQNIDWAIVAKNIDAWCEKITLDCMQ